MSTLADAELIVRRYAALAPSERTRRLVRHAKTISGLEPALAGELIERAINADPWEAARITRRGKA